MNLPLVMPKMIGLRARLLAAFAVVVIMAGICGFVGLFYVNRIGTSVNTFSGISSPLLTEATFLLDNSDRIRSIVMQAIRTGKGFEELSNQLEKLQQSDLEHLNTIERLANAAGVEVQVDHARRNERTVVDALNSLVTAHLRVQAASQVAERQIEEFDRKIEKIQGSLQGLIRQAEERIADALEEANVATRTKTATVEGLGDLISNLLTETNQVLIYASKLLYETENVREVLPVHSELTGLDELRVLEKKLKLMFQDIDVVLGQLTDRLHGPQGWPGFVMLQDDYAGLKALAVNAGGILTMQHHFLLAVRDVSNGRETADQIYQIYSRVLDQVRDAVASVNEEARQSAVGAVTQAQRIVTASILLTLLGALALGLMFARRITAPLSQLTEHLTGIRRSGEMVPLDRVEMIGKSDEIGTLSRSFNEMISELAEARRQLIKQSEEEVRVQYERLNAAISNMPQGLCMFDAEKRLIVSNHRFAEIYGLKPEQILTGTQLETVLEYANALELATSHEIDHSSEVLQGVADHKVRYFVRELRDGRYIANTYKPMPDGGSIATHEDITEQRKAEARIKHLATHDSLTGLPNRVDFREQLTQLLGRASRDELLAVITFDLDHFKAVNDTLGHPVGDGLLKAVAKRLKGLIRRTDAVARLGGDEFAVLQLSADQPASATRLATRIIEKLSYPYRVAEHQVVIGASVGIALAPNDGDDPDTLLRNSDMALYRSKEEGRGTYWFYEPEMDAKIQARRALELDLRKAMASSEFEIFYQPLIKIEDYSISSFEALLRWRHPEMGLVSPGEFIPLAEEIGLIGQIGRWVVKEACKAAMSWPAPDIGIAVNVSPMQFRGDTLVLDVITALAESKLPAHRLELEITEEVMLENTDRTLSTLGQLHNLGVRISMDDFGTGYSSLGYLQKFPFDKIKIDASFVKEITKTKGSLEIVRAVVSLASTFGMKTTAEGVETEDQLQRIEEEGYTEAQGYLFSKPVPADQVETLLRRFKPKSKKNIA